MREIFDLAHTPIEDGTTLIEASAGTGKTYCITGLVLRLLLERRVERIGEILVVTFTNAATAELVERIRTRLEDARSVLAGERAPSERLLEALLDRHGSAGASVIEDAQRQLDELAVSTIHGFCNRVLEESAFESGVPYDSELTADASDLLAQAAEDFWRLTVYPAGDLAGAVVVARALTPASFLRDFATRFRHPNVEVLPRPLELAEAIVQIETACSQARGTWPRSRLATWLEKVSFLAGGDLAGANGAELTARVEAFCSGRTAADVAVLALFTPESLAQSIHKKDLKQVDFEDPFLLACGRFQRAVEAFVHALRCRFLADVRPSFERAKSASGVLTYDDLLERVRDALRDRDRGRRLARAIRQRHRVALIDEFQDTDLVQYEIFGSVFGAGPLFLIGDPKQAIYGFRGADVFAYFAAKRAASREYTLGSNWRSTRELVASIADVFGGNGRPFVYDDIPFTGVEAARAGELCGLGESDDRALQWMWLGRATNREAATERVAKAVADETVRLLEEATLDGKPMRPSDIAVIVREHAEAHTVQRALQAARVPAVLGKTGDIFRSEEMGDLHRLLDAIADPAAHGRVRAALATRLLGWSAAELVALERDDEAWQRLSDQLLGHRSAWQQHGFISMIDGLLAAYDVRPRLYAYEDGDRRLTNLRHAIEILHRAATERHLSVRGLLDWLTAEREAERHDEDASQLRLERDANAVQVVTVHAAKGLEYEVVFCPFLWRGPRDGGGLPVVAHVDGGGKVMDFGSERLDDHRAAARAESLSEDLRLAYVAMTRARRRCYVAWGDCGRDGGSDSALAYLLFGPTAQSTGLDAAAHVAEVRGHVANARGKDVDPQAWRRPLDSLVAAHGDRTKLIDCSEASEHPGRVWRSPAAPAVPLRARRFEADRRRLEPWRIESFTSLHGSGASGEAHDRIDPTMSRPLAEDGAPHGIYAFAKGPRAGICLHEILEQTDFSRAADAPAIDRVRTTLQRYGLLAGDSHAANLDPTRVVVELIERLRRCPIPGTAHGLSDVTRDRRLDEWKFHTTLRAFDARTLARIFSRYAREPIRNDYAPRLERLRAETIGGFLTGFVDMVFEIDGRWYLVDWKSNHLGNRAGDYGDDELWSAMCDHDYILQYHLYVLALHRHLRARLRDYDYDRDFGGVFYVFLRGLTEAGADAAVEQPSAAAPTGTLPNGPLPSGWYGDRPPRALVDTLETSLIAVASGDSGSSRS